VKAGIQPRLARSAVVSFHFKADGLFSTGCQVRFFKKHHSGQNAGRFIPRKREACPSSSEGETHRKRRRFPVQSLHFEAGPLFLTRCQVRFLKKQNAGQSTGRLIPRKREASPQLFEGQRIQSTAGLAFDPSFISEPIFCFQ